MRVHIGHHFYGAGNMGDDVMLAGFLEALSAQDANILLSCCSPFDLRSQRRRFPQIEWLPYTSEIRQAAIAACDCWLGLGDTPFQSDSGNWFVEHLADEALWCKQRRLPMWFLGIGVNDREVFDLPQMRFILDRAEGIWARDVVSANHIANHFPVSKIRLGADLANICLRRRAQGGDAPCENCIGLCLHFEDRSMFDLPHLETSIRGAGDRDVVWLIQEVRVLDYSERRLLDMLSERVRQHLVLREPRYADASLDEMLATWGRCEIVVSSRYHAGLIQAWSGGRLALVARNQKLRGLADQLQCPLIETLGGPRNLDDAIAIAEPSDPHRLSALADLAESAVSEWLAASGNAASN